MLNIIYLTILTTLSCDAYVTVSAVTHTRPSSMLWRWVSAPAISVVHSKPTGLAAKTPRVPRRPTPVNWNIKTQRKMNSVCMDPVRMNPVRMNPVRMNPVCMSPVCMNPVCMNPVCNTLLTYCSFVSLLFYFLSFLFTQFREKGGGIF